MNTPFLFCACALLHCLPALSGGHGPGRPPSQPSGPSPIRLDAWLDPSSLLFPAAGFELAAFPAAPLLPPSNACDHVAFVAREAALRDAMESYLKAIANCLNEGGDHGPCTVQHHQDWLEARALVWQQHAARLHVCDLLGGGTYNPPIVPSAFSANVTNPYFPLVVDRTLVYEKLTAEGIERTAVTTQSATVVLAGVTCRVVRDVVTIGTATIEDTDDWYAQDTAGNVWYLGELARNYENGQLHDLDGSWRTGEESAKPGIVMQANPQVGNAYRQEFLLGEAEDYAVVVAVGQTVVVPFGTFTNCIATEDATAIEPDGLERKFYAPGLGHVLTINVGTGARTELVNVLN